MGRGTLLALEVLVWMLQSFTDAEKVYPGLSAPRQNACCLFGQFAWRNRSV